MDLNSIQSGKKRKSTGAGKQPRFRPKILDDGKPEKKFRTATESFSHDTEKKVSKRIPEDASKISESEQIVAGLDPETPRRKYSCRRYLQVDDIEDTGVARPSVFGALVSSLGSKDEDFDSYMEKWIGEYQNQNLNELCNGGQGKAKHDIEDTEVARPSVFSALVSSLGFKEEDFDSYMEKIIGQGKAFIPDGDKLRNGGSRRVARKRDQDNFIRSENQDPLSNENKLNRLIFGNHKAGNVLYGIDSPIHIFESSRIPRKPRTNRKVVPNTWDIRKLPKLKKRKFVPKVLLDEETLQVWKILMRNDTKVWKRLLENDHEATESGEEETKTWEEKNKSLLERVNKFINIMNFIQGFRELSPWKGSVIDSIVGVFLTQNVADSISSEAYMELTSRYPVSQDVPSLQRSILTKEDFGSSNNRMQKEASGPDVNDAEVKKQKASEEKPKMMRKREVKGKENINWNEMRQTYSSKEPRHVDSMDSANWNVVRLAPVEEIAKAISCRGMYNRLAERIQNFLEDALIYNNGDLEWLKNASDDIARKYLLSHYGLGLKSAECVRLLSLFKPAFPVDVNVARIAVRLGWIPLQALPKDIDFDLLEKYPNENKIQKYLWAHLCTLDKETLIQLHYHLITFGKVFCTKLKPNCSACPLKGECKHYAMASSRFKPSDPIGAHVESSSSHSISEKNTPNHASDLTFESLDLQPLGFDRVLDRDLPSYSMPDTCDPIVEMPPSPEPTRSLELSCDVREKEGDLGSEIKMPTTMHSREDMMARGLESHEKSRWDFSKAMVLKGFSLPFEKLTKKIESPLKTMHRVYVLKDGHPFLRTFDEREVNDPIPYLLATWTSSEVRKGDGDDLVGSNKGRHDSITAGTILIPCQTAVRGRFPLSGTYFQPNEMFADDETSHSPINISEKDLQDLEDRTLYCGTSATTIYRGMSLKDIHYCFWKGIICIRGFNRRTRGPKPLHSLFRKTDDSSRKKNSEE